MEEGSKMEPVLALLKLGLDALGSFVPGQHQPLPVSTMQMAGSSLWDSHFSALLPGVWLVVGPLRSGFTHTRFSSVAVPDSCCIISPASFGMSPSLGTAVVCPAFQLQSQGMPPVDSTDLIWGSGSSCCRCGPTLGFSMSLSIVTIPVFLG